VVIAKPVMLQFPARFFLYFANCLPLARTHSHGRSFWCIDRGNSEFSDARNVVKEAPASTTLTGPIVIQ